MSLRDPELKSSYQIAEWIKDNLPTVCMKGLTEAETKQRFRTQGDTVGEAFRQVANEEPHLTLDLSSRHGLVLFESPFEATSNGYWTPWGKWQAQRKGKRIADYAKKRAELFFIRDGLFNEVDYLGQQESDLLELGRTTESKGMRRRYAADLLLKRKEIDRKNGLANAIGKQIDIMSGHIHNISAKLCGQAIELPSLNEIEENLLNTEQILGDLTEKSVAIDVADETIREASDVSETEASIMAEFDPPEKTQAEAQALKTVPKEAVKKTIGLKMRTKRKTENQEPLKETYDDIPF